MVEKLRRIPYYGMITLLVYMPFHIFLAQSLSLLTGDLSAWKIGKDILAALIAAVTGLLVVIKVKKSPEKKVFNLYLLFAGCYLLLHLLLWVINPAIYKQEALLGSVYNNRLLWYLLIGMGSVLLLPQKYKQPALVRVIITISTVVCLLGLLQRFLPVNILSHLGYSDARGAKPSFLVDNKSNLPRVFSTLRDPNTLGSYLIVPLMIISYYWLKLPRRRVLLGGLGLLHGLILLLTFSRSAMLGLVLSEVCLLILLYREKTWEYIKSHGLVLGATLVFICFGLFYLRNQYFVQNAVFHSDENTTAAQDSNQKHISYVLNGLRGIKTKPLGHGPGTAGPVSMHTSSPVITENYFVQIGYEVGVFGLLVFIAINALIYKQLLQNKTPLALCLVASLLGYILVNMFLHIWGNEAVAAQWWLLAGVAVVANRTGKTKKV